MRWYPSNQLKGARVWAPAVVLGLFSCVAPPLQSPEPHVDQQTTIRIAQNVKNKVDLLFAIDRVRHVIGEVNAFGDSFPTSRTRGAAPGTGRWARRPPGGGPATPWCRERERARPRP